MLATNGQETQSLRTLVVLTVWQLLMALLVTVVKPNIVPFTNSIDIICSWIDSVNYLLITLTKYGQIVPKVSGCTPVGWQP